MRSKITSKYQITVPKEVREALKLEATDLLEWEVGEGGIKVHAAEKPFLALKGMLNRGSGDLKGDVKRAWEERAARYRP